MRAGLFFFAQLVLCQCRFLYHAPICVNPKQVIGIDYQAIRKIRVNPKSYNLSSY